MNDVTISLRHLLTESRCRAPHLTHVVLIFLHFMVKSHTWNLYRNDYSK